KKKNTPKPLKIAPPEGGGALRSGRPRAHTVNARPRPSRRRLAPRGGPAAISPSPPGWERAEGDEAEPLRAVFPGGARHRPPAAAPSHGELVPGSLDFVPRLGRIRPAGAEPGEGEELNALQNELGPYGLVVLGFPSNQFGKQEPGQNSEILPALKYVRPGGGFVPNFQLFQKGDVNGAKEQKVYSFLKVGAVPKGGASTQRAFFLGRGTHKALTCRPNLAELLPTGGGGVREPQEPLLGAPAEPRHQVELREVPGGPRRRARHALVPPRQHRHREERHHRLHAAAAGAVGPGRRGSPQNALSPLKTQPQAASPSLSPRTIPHRLLPTSPPAGDPPPKPPAQPPAHPKAQRAQGSPPPGAEVRISMKAWPESPRCGAGRA
uniref:glutathione peroxidase n=1 Tax=Anas zonorhyncha TaxID=75864 RepID=A0A8B9UH95_9AVES